MSDLMSGLSALDASHDSYDEANMYYRGDVEEFFASTRLQRAVIRSGMNTRFNFAKKPVDARAERLEIAAVSSPDADQNATLAALWTENQLALEAPATMRKALTHGDGYLLVWPASPEDPEAGPQLSAPGPDGDPEGTDPLATSTSSVAPERVFMFYNSPTTMRLFYDPENPLQKSYAIKRWESAEGIRTDLLYPDRIEKYLASKDADMSKDEAWTLYDEEDDGEWPVENPFGEIPVFHFRTDRPYGVPVHSGFYGPQDAITKLITSHLSTIDFASGPQRYAMLEAGAETDEAEDADFAIDGAETTGTPATSGEGDSQYTAHPGSLWLMRNVKGVGQFDAAAPAIFTDPMLTYLRMGADITTTPMDKIDPTGSTESGESRRARESSFVKSVRNLQLSFGSTWSEAFAFALRVKAYLREAPAPAATVDVRWAPAASVDDKDFWEMAEKKIAAGVPRYQVMLEAGYTADQLLEWGIAPNQTADAAPNGQANQ